jgi:hypothetical protein
MHASLRDSRAVRTSALASLVLLFAGSNLDVARAAAPAFDDSTSAAYDDGWNSGDNGGSGFGPWSFTGANAAFGMSSSTANGDGDTNLDGDIDIGGDAFGITSSTSGTRQARRPFSSPFAIGETLTLVFDAPLVANNQNSYQGSIELLTATNSERLRFGLFPGAGGWGIVDGGGYEPFVGILQTDEGIGVSITRTGETTYELVATGLQEDPLVQTGTFAGSGDIASFRITHMGVSSGTLRTFANSFQVVPEAGDTAATIAIAALATLARTRRRPWGSTHG